MIRVAWRYFVGDRPRGRTDKIECYIQGCQAAPEIVVASLGASQATCCEGHARQWVESPLGEEARHRPQVAFDLLDRWAVRIAREAAEEQDEGKLPTNLIPSSDPHTTSSVRSDPPQPRL